MEQSAEGIELRTNGGSERAEGDEGRWEAWMPGSWQPNELQIQKPAPLLSLAFKLSGLPAFQLTSLPAFKPSHYVPLSFHL